MYKYLSLYGPIKPRNDIHFNAAYDGYFNAADVIDYAVHRYNDTVYEYIRYVLPEQTPQIEGIYINGYDLLNFKYIYINITKI